VRVVLAQVVCVALVLVLTRGTRVAADNAPGGVGITCSHVVVVGGVRGTGGVRMVGVGTYGVRGAGGGRMACDGDGVRGVRAVGSVRGVAIVQEISP
jgi:hypothetical protein